MFKFTKIDFVELIKKYKVAILITAIIGVALGVLLILSPFVAGGILIWVAIALFGLGGIGLIIRFIVPGKGNSRDGVSLACGILIVLLVAGLVTAACLTQDVATPEGKTIPGATALTVRMVVVFSIFFGVFAVIENIFLLCTIGKVPSGQKGLVIFKSILGIIIGIFMIIFPIVMFAVGIIIAGVYILVMCITAIVLDIKFWKGDKKPVQEKADVIDAKVEDKKEDK